MRSSRRRTHLTGFPEAVTAVFPKTEAHLCIAHMARSSVKFVTCKDRKAVAADLKKIYPAPPEEPAAAVPDDFAKTRDARYPMISKSWRSRRAEAIPCLKFSPEIRRAVCTASAIEPVNYTVQKVVRNRQSFPNDGAAMKLIYMALQKTAKKRTMPIWDWGVALNQVALICGDRVPL